MTRGMAHGLAIAILNPITPVFQKLITRGENEEVLRVMYHFSETRQPLLVLLGSESDRDEANVLLRHFEDVDHVVIVSSIHRNPEVVFAIACMVPDDVVILTIGGMSFQLPAVLRAFLVSLGRAHNPIAVYPVGTQQEAARSAVTVLPGGMSNDLMLIGEEERPASFSRRVKELLTLPLVSGNVTINIQPPSKPPKVLKAGEEEIDKPLAANSTLVGT